MSLQLSLFSWTILAKCGHRSDAVVAKAKSVDKRLAPWSDPGSPHLLLGRWVLPRQAVSQRHLWSPGISKLFLGIRRNKPFILVLARQIARLFSQHDTRRARTSQDLSSTSLRKPQPLLLLLGRPWTHRTHNGQPTGRNPQGAITVTNVDSWTHVLFLIPGVMGAFSRVYPIERDVYQIGYQQVHPTRQAWVYTCVTVSEMIYNVQK